MSMYSPRFMSWGSVGCMPYFSHKSVLSQGQHCYPVWCKPVFYVPVWADWSGCYFLFMVFCFVFVFLKPLWLLSALRSDLYVWCLVLLCFFLLSYGFYFTKRTLCPMDENRRLNMTTQQLIYIDVSTMSKEDVEFTFHAQLMPNFQIEWANPLPVHCSVEHCKWQCSGLAKYMQLGGGGKSCDYFCGSFSGSRGMYIIMCNCFRHSCHHLIKCSVLSRKVLFI